MTRVSPFFIFNGQCAAAIALYEKALGGKVTYQSTYAQAQKNDPAAKDEAKKDWIYHAQMKIGRQILMLCDGDEDKIGTGTAMRPSELCLCAEFDTPDEVTAAYEIMQQGGTTIEPMSSSSYSARFVFVQDKFGVRWWLMTKE